MTTIPLWRHRLATLAALAALPMLTAQAAERTVDSLTADFRNAVSTNYSTSQYPWQVLTCTPDASNCFGTNPDSPYGAPDFDPTNTHTSVTTLNDTDALVLIMETPPSMRYFGVTPYLFTRYYPSHLAGNPLTPGFVPVFESLGDTVNQKVIGTTGSTTPGVNPFGQLSALVMTADALTGAQVLGAFKAIGFPGSAVNRMPMPLSGAHLNMGSGPTKDTYTAMLRVAYPDNPQALADYLSRKPVQVVRMSALTARKLKPVDEAASRVPGTGVSESAALLSARDTLAADLQARFAGSGYTIAERTVDFKQTVNYLCIDNALPCNGDNPDALYSRDVANYAPQPSDRVLIVGINHVATGKATYLSHSIVADANNRGLLAVSDAWLAGTGLVMGQVSGPSDPRYATYSQLYAFTIAYDCAGDPVCVTIPAADAPAGTALNVTARIYLEAATRTRPSSAEIGPHRVFVMKK
jgi:hypothetical protein